MEFQDWLRGVNAVLGAAVLVLLIARVTMVWKRYSYSQKMVFAGLLCYVIANTYGSIELIVQHAPFSIRTVVILAGNVILLVYLAEPESRYKARLGQELRLR